MSKLAKVNNNMLEATAEMFIIPNRPTRIYEFLTCNGIIKNFASELLGNAGMGSANANTLLIEV